MHLINQPIAGYGSFQAQSVELVLAPPCTASWPSPSHRSAPQLCSLPLPGKEPAGHAPDGGFLRLLRGNILLLAAAPSLLEGEEPAPAWGSLDRATPSGPLQHLHHPHGGQYPSWGRGQVLEARLHWGGSAVCY